jgi:serine/threonine-protein phosphatase 2A activator
MLRKIPSLPNIYESYQAVEPIRRIHEQKDIEIFSRSQAFDRIMTFIALLNESVHKKLISDPCRISPQTRRILEMLDKLDSWLNDFPPLENPQRFGNKAFRQWMEHLRQHSTQLLETILPEPLHKAMSELREYFCNSFGNDTRIDYGSGHELSFVAWLAGIALLGGFTEDDYQAVVTRIFVRYLELVRKIQKTYSLEPAGSHGVWGLDDHQFLPYVWGSSQLVDHPMLKPKSILNRDTVNHFSNEYMYFRCIQYILEVKRGPFFEHSPMLNDIASLLSWNKVNTGMTKMFIAEVLKKVPVVQHFKFGNLFPFEELKQQK